MYIFLKILDLFIITVPWQIGNEVRHLWTTIDVSDNHLESQSSNVNSVDCVFDFWVVIPPFYFIHGNTPKLFMKPTNELQQQQLHVLKGLCLSCLMWKSGKTICQW